MRIKNQKEEEAHEVFITLIVFIVIFLVDLRLELCQVNIL